MEFLDSYKELEKLCSDIYGDHHSLSIYIDEMLSKPDGSYYVLGGERYKDLSDADKFRVRMGGGDYISSREQNTESTSSDNSKISSAEREDTKHNG